MAETLRVGFIGLGIMGVAMARNALAAGFSVRAYNRSEAGRQLGRSAGLTLVKTLKELAASSDVIITMVTDASSVAQIWTGPDGLREGSRARQIWIQMSTIDEPSTLHFAEEAAAAGIRFLDCPVTGSKKQAEGAELILLAGGEADLIDQCRPLLQSMGKTIIDAGPVGKGSALKLCMNLIVAQMTTALCESVALAEAQSVAPEKVFEVLEASPALNCGYFRIKKQAILGRDFSPAFSLDNMLKDVTFMTQAARANNMELPVLEAVKTLMVSARDAGLGPQDLTSIFHLLRKEATQCKT